MIDTQSRIALPSPGLVIPERIGVFLTRMKSAKSFGITLLNKVAPCGTGARMKKRVSNPLRRIMNVNIFWNDVKLRTLRHNHIARRSAGGEAIAFHRHIGAVEFAG